MIETVSIICSICISVISLIISILSYHLKSPKLEIQILNKNTDCYFGTVEGETNGIIHKDRIAGVKARIINKSPHNVQIMGLKLKCGKEFYKLINSSLPYWKIVGFEYFDSQEKVTDGTGIFYKKDGIKLPVDIKAYGGLDFVALFYSFPFDIVKEKRAKIIIQTTFGEKTKKIILHNYSGQFADEDYRDYLQLLRSKESHEIEFKN